MSVFDYDSYRDYLENRFGKTGVRSGHRKKLAEGMGVHSTLISQVFSGRTDFSVEQAESINQILSHTDKESEYFLSLVMFERAGTEALKKRLKKRITELKEHHINIKERLKKDEEALSGDDRARYYSTYLYAAVRLMATFPEVKDRTKMAAALKISPKELNEILEFLLQMKLVTETKKGLQTGPTHIHQGKDSPHFFKTQSNFRLLTMNHLRPGREDDVHYSGFVTLSEKDAFKIKNSLLENLKSHLEIVDKSPVETAYVYCFDFFPYFNKGDL